MAERAVVGTAIGTVASRASKTYKNNRVCGHSGCGTVLSIYNKGKFCYQHEPMSTPRTRGRKIA